MFRVHVWDNLGTSHGHIARHSPTTCSILNASKCTFEVLLVHCLAYNVLNINRSEASSCRQLKKGRLETLFVRDFAPAAAAIRTLRRLFFEEPLVDAAGNPCPLKLSWCPTVSFACRPNCSFQVVCSIWVLIVRAFSGRWRRWSGEFNGLRVTSVPDTASRCNALLTGHMAGLSSGQSLVYGAGWQRTILVQQHWGH